MTIITGPQAAATFLLAALEIEHVIHDAMTDATKLVADAAKAKIGVQQNDWPPLADSTEDRKARGGYPTGAPLLREGDYRESIYGHAIGASGYVGSKDPAAAPTEFGTTHQPPRPVIGPAIYENHDKIAEIIGEHVTKKLGGR